MMRWWLAISILPFLAVAVRAEDKPTTAQIEYFEAKVRPILADNCYSCHGAKKQSAGLRLDTAAGIQKGTDGVAVVVAGDPGKSKLIRSVNRQGDAPMPPEPKPPLKSEAIAVLTEWVRTGAAVPPDAGVKPGADPRKHWAFQPLRPVVSPKVDTAGAEVRNEIDRFILARLNGTGLSQSPQADRYTLIRRAYFDLIGLPPTAAEVEAFVRDPDPKAWENLIDRLLSSPRYGERWGRYWLDIARYADTKGYVFNEDRAFPFAYTYRDYVIQSFNDDKPFDRFILEQLAADKLDLGEDRRPLAALGFITLGRRFLNNRHDIIDDRIDVVTRGFMGLTVTCARCHDHKFDPVPIADYYSLYGVFSSTAEPKELPLIGEVKRTPELVAFEKEVEKRDAAYRAEVEKRHAGHLKKLRESATIANYLRAAFEVRGKPEGHLQTLARDRELSPFALARWRTFLVSEIKDRSPVYLPLAALAEIPENQFADEAPGIIASLGKDEKLPANPRVQKALVDAKPRMFSAAVEAVATVLAKAPLAGARSDADAQLAKAIGPGGPTDIAVVDAEKIQNRADRDALAAIRKRNDAFKAASPFAPPRAHVLNDIPEPFAPYVFIRGNQNNHGPLVPKHAPAIVDSNRKPFTDGSGRLELARVIANPENPLTARVMVNRVWAGHFGHGLVRTPSDFGTRADPPSHPKLLDWLAARFVKDEWSVKRLHRLIMQSATYQQSSNVNAESAKRDPENRLLSRQNRRRLDFEALRDSLLLVANRLDLTAGGKPVDLFKAPYSTRRSVYGLIDRTSFPGTMRSFDVASPDQHAPQRYQTTVPQQALFLMNSPFVTDQARALASRPEVADARNPEEKATALYRLALARKPTREELELAIAFTAGEDDRKLTFGKWPQLAQVLMLSNGFAFVD